MVQVSAHLKIFAHGEISENSASLRRHRDAARDELVRGFAADVFFLEKDLSGAWREQAGNSAQRCSLASAVRTDERYDFTFLDVQRDAG